MLIEDIPFKCAYPISFKLIGCGEEEEPLLLSFHGPSDEDEGQSPERINKLRHKSPHQMGNVRLGHAALGLCLRMCERGSVVFSSSSFSTHLMNEMKCKGAFKPKVNVQRVAAIDAIFFQAARLGRRNVLYIIML